MAMQARELDLLVVGAGPAGIALVAEARAAGVPAERILVLEKADTHSWIIRKYYAPSKPVLANYKGIEARCDGVLCIPDLSREETLTYLDSAIRDSGVEVRYREDVHRIAREPDGRFRVESSGGVCRSRIVVIAIGVLGRPAKPSYPIPASLKGKIFFDITSEPMEGLDALVVGGGDTACEYCQFLVQEGNRVTLSYRGAELTAGPGQPRKRIRPRTAGAALGPLGLERLGPRARRRKGSSPLRGAGASALRVRPPRLRARRHDAGELLEVGGHRVRRSFAEADGGVRHERARPLRRGGPDGREERGLDHPGLQHRRFRDAADLPGAWNLRERDFAALIEEDPVCIRTPPSLSVRRTFSD